MQIMEQKKDTFVKRYLSASRRTGNRGFKGMQNPLKFP